MSRSKGQPRLPIEDKVRIVLAVLAGEVTVAEAARRHGVSEQSVANWRDRFVESGKAGLDNQLPGGAGQAGSQTERRLRAEAEQLKKPYDAWPSRCDHGGRWVPGTRWDS